MGDIQHNYVLSRIDHNTLVDAISAYITQCHTLHAGAQSEIEKTHWSNEIIRVRNILTTVHRGSKPL